ncbi:hypothetical protein [Frigoriflavimonas asaccharolytica]|uniref:Lipoprotein n=1 Tax=Frigoriflavimonas asaccharolytica TaxID=2735899 RepID=A0A8J8G631_9FLAO|nr:hypothetical protein [Frigoriflavimonas asaccharolytica]NRS91808.1 hypothetical protein [Frigoriflavimonas asaccharolytica]
MKKLFKLSILFVFIFTMKSCAQNPELGKDIIDLKTFPISFNANDFYKNQIKIHKKSRELLSQGKFEESVSDELLKNYKFVEKIDTLSIDDNVPLLYYGMEGMATKDTLAIFEGIKFEKIEMFTNISNVFQSLRAISYAYKDGKKNFNTLKQKLEIEYGKPKIIKENLEHKEYYEWTTEDLVINLILNVEDEKDNDKSFVAELYLTNKKEYENFKNNVIGKTKYYWFY